MINLVLNVAFHNIYSPNYIPCSLKTGCSIFSYKIVEQSSKFIAHTLYNSLLKV
jgi:hypothetical protein